MRSSASGFRSGLTPFTRNLLLFSIFHVVVVNGCLSLASRSLEAVNLVPAYAAPTGVGATLSFLMFQQGGDSWTPMLEAIRLHELQQPVYDTLFFSQGIKFQYPLTSLLPLMGLRQTGITNDGFLWIANIASWGSVWITLATTIALVIVIRRRKGVLVRSEWIAIAFSVFLSGACFYPIQRGYALGQIQVFLTMLFAIALLLWVRGKEWSAGALLGVMSLIKPQYALFVLWFALRGRYRALSGTLLVGAAGFAAAVAVFGWQEQLKYLDVLQFIGKRGESFYANLSVNGVAHRLIFNGPNLEWDPHSFAPYHPAVYAITLTSSALVLGLALFSGRRAKGFGGLTDFGAMALAATVASPIAWDHHLGITFPVLAAFAASAPHRLRIIGAAYLAAASSWSAFNALAGAPVLNVLQSICLFGVLAALIALYQERNHPVYRADSDRKTAIQLPGELDKSAVSGA